MTNQDKAILIIEDEPALLEILKDKFTAEGFKVRTARDGEEGLAEVTRERPAAILLDIIMPRMDGITMLKKLRQDVNNAQIPVIVLTNLADSDAVVTSLEHGAFDYLIKTDWQLNEVVKKVKHRLHLK